MARASLHFDRESPDSSFAAAALAAVGATSAARAAEGFVIGDSTAASFAQTVGIRSIASHSVSVRRNFPRPIAPQFARLPKGAVTLMLLGLNDAFTPVKGLQKDIEWVIDGALATGEKIVWIGPPCVLKKWDSRAKEMDDYLRQRLASTSIQYVSLRDPQICQPALRASDGMHFTTAGNRYVWEKIQRDSSYAATIVLAKPATAPPVAASASASPRRMSLRLQARSPSRMSLQLQARRSPGQSGGSAIKMQTRLLRQCRERTVGFSCRRGRGLARGAARIPSPRLRG